jgi:hypothetical protein
MADLPKGILQREYEKFQTLPNGEVAIKTIALTTTPVFGQVIIASTGVAVQFPTNNLHNGIIITGKSTNLGDMYLGNSNVDNLGDGTGKGYILEAGNSISYAIRDTSILYVNGTAGDMLSFAGS